MDMIWDISARLHRATRFSLIILATLMVLGIATGVVIVQGHLKGEPVHVQVDDEAARVACMNQGFVVVYLDGIDLDGYGTAYCVEGGQKFWNEVPLAPDSNELDPTVH